MLALDSGLGGLMRVSYWRTERRSEVQEGAYGVAGTKLLLRTDNGTATLSRVERRLSPDDGLTLRGSAARL